MLAVFWIRHDIAGFGEIAGPWYGMLETVTSQIELVLRSAGLAIALVLALACAARGGWRQRADLLALVGCASAYLACSASYGPCTRAPAALPLLLGAVGFPFALWRLARVILEDEVRIHRWAWAGLAVLLASGVAAAAGYIGLPTGWSGPATGVQKLVAFGFVGSALLAAWRSWKGDLVEGRRRLRWLLVGYLGGYGLVVLVGEVYLQGQRPPAWLDLLNVAMIDLTLLATTLYLVAPNAHALETLFALPAARARPATPSAAPQDGADQAALLARLQGLMQEHRLYRDPALSVGTLAQRMAIPEYVLRRLMHDHLGHRNFAAFVNTYRLREVSAQLLDPDLDRRPVLTLALEAGYGSIGPFNRQFKEHHGVTPTAFRAHRGADSSALT